MDVLRSPSNMRYGLCEIREQPINMIQGALDYITVVMCVFVFCREYANSRGFNVIPFFTGHGIGEYFHEPPHIFPVGK